MQPDSSPYFTDDTPPEWGLVVADFVEQRAEQSEKLDDRQGEYLTTLKDSALAKEFKSHAIQYSKELWRWANEDVPSDIKEWVLGNVSEPYLETQDRLGYLLIRRETMDWWSIRGRTDPTAEALRTEAMRLMCTTQFLGLASSLSDFAFFEHLVAAKKQTRPNKRPVELAFMLRSYWMAWSLWQNDHSGRIALLKRRVNFEIGKTAMSETITALQLRP